MPTRFTAVITKSEDLPLFVARCPQVGTVSQGKTKEEALKNLKEATELYLEEVTDSSPCLAFPLESLLEKSSVLSSAWAFIFSGRKERYAGDVCSRKSPQSKPRSSPPVRASP